MVDIGLKGVYYSYIVILKEWQKAAKGNFSNINILNGE